MNKNYDINKRNNLAKLRKKPTFIFLFFVVFLIVTAIVLLNYSYIFALTIEEEEMFTIICYISILFLTLLFFILMLRFIRPTYILQNDLKNIYIVKKYNKEIIVPIDQLKKFKVKVKSGKKAKKEYGTLIMATTNRKNYKIKNIYDVTKVKNDIIILIEKLQIYLEGIRQGSKEVENKKRKIFKRVSKPF